MRKSLLSFILSIAGLSIASADAPLAPEALDEEPIQGIIATFDGAETSYKLEDMFIIKYLDVEGELYVALYLKDLDVPILSISLAEGKELEVAYGEYVPSTPTAIEGVGNDRAVITERNGKKIVSGGKLIIIGKDGKMYNTSGVEIK